MTFSLLYSFLLHLYPAPFRAEFSLEMQTVFAESLEDARKQGKRSMFLLVLRELAHLPAWAIIERFEGWRKPGGTQMASEFKASISSSSNALEQPDPPGSTLTLLLGLFPILLLGFGTISVETPLRFLWDGLVNFPILYVLILVVAGIAWYLGSPRWSYSYTGFLLVFTWYLEGFRAPAFMIENAWILRNGQLLGKWIWVPWVVTLIIVLLARRSWKPVKEFFQNFRRDWTLYTFLLYSTMPWLSWALFDEIRNQPLVIISVLVADLSLGIGAFFYFQLRTINQRALSLLYGMLPAILITVIATSVYWHGRQEMWMKYPENGYASALREFIFYAIVLLIMFFPGLVSLVKHRKLNLRSA